MVNPALFPEFAGVDFNRAVDGADFVPPVSQQDEMLSLIFAPDPDMGLPRSDLAIVMSKDTAPEIARYIQDTLQRPLPERSLSDNPDDCLAFIKAKNERLSDYADRLRSIVSESFANEQKSS